MSKSNVTLHTTPSQRWKESTKVHQSLVAALAALVLLVAASCGGGGSSKADDAPSTTRATSTTTAEPTTTTPPSPEDQAKQAYLDFLDMYTRIATTTVDPNDPELAMRMVDPALSGLRTVLSTWQAQGQIWIEGDQTRHTVTSVSVHPDGLTADIIDCEVGNDALVQRGTTAATLPSPQTNRALTTMVNQNGRWLVHDSDARGHWEGVAGCAS
jgi:hypothetical protein